MSHARQHSGTLTFKSDDGYVLSAPVEWFETHVDNDYSDLQIGDLLDSGSIFRTDYSVEFKARLAYGQSYTIKDLGVEVERTLAVKGNINDFDRDSAKDWRSALGVPPQATARYNLKKQETKFTWTERVIMDG